MIALIVLAGDDNMNDDNDIYRALTTLQALFQRLSRIITFESHIPRRGSHYCPCLRMGSWDSEHFNGLHSCQGWETRGSTSPLTVWFSHRIVIPRKYHNSSLPPQHHAQHTAGVQPTLVESVPPGKTVHGFAIFFGWETMLLSVLSRTIAKKNP